MSSAPQRESGLLPGFISCKKGGEIGRPTCVLCHVANSKTYSLQVVHGRLFGMGQSKANQWIHVLLPVLLAALRTLGDAPTRSLAALAQRLGVTVSEAAVVTPVGEEEAPAVAPTSAAATAAPLLPMTGRNGASSVPKTLLHRPIVIAARKKTTR